MKAHGYPHRIVMLAAQAGYATPDLVAIARAAQLGESTVRRWMRGEHVSIETDHRLRQTLGLSTTGGAQ